MQEVKKSILETDGDFVRDKSEIEMQEIMQVSMLFSSRTRNTQLNNIFKHSK